MNSTSLAPAALVTATLLAACLSSSPSYQVSWKEAVAQSGTTTDNRGGVLIIGGSVVGPSTSGGYAQWVVTAEAGRIKNVSFSIFTSGSAWYGKGIHSTRPNGQVDIFLNDVLVHTIICDERVASGDYWPRRLSLGSGSYTSPTIDVSSQAISGPTFTIKVIASPFTVLDVDSIRMTVAFEQK